VAPSQLGFGVPLGAEAAAHAARTFLTNLGTGQAMLKIDFSNAFSTLRSDEMLKFIHRELPALYPFIQSCYFHKSFLQFGQFTMVSDEGHYARRPTQPSVFCGTALSLINWTKSAFNCWYMDDGTISGAVEQLMKDFRVIVKEGEKFGLVVNTRKCKVITDDDDVIEKFRLVAPEITHVRTSAVMLLGAPAGSKQSIDAVLENKLQEL